MHTYTHTDLIVGELPTSTEGHLIAHKLSFQRHGDNVSKHIGLGP